MTHALKTWPAYFDAIWRGDKTFEVREADRPFVVGDVLHLREYEKASCCYTGREIFVTVTYIMSGGQFGIANGTCVIGFRVNLKGENAS